MGFIKSAGMTVIGHARNAGHLYHFTDSLGALWCAYQDFYTGHGIIMKSRDQGITWFETDDVGPVDSITIRGGYAGYILGPKVSVYDLDEGFVMFQRSYTGTVVNGFTTFPQGPIIPVPELGGFAMIPPYAGGYGGYYHTLFNVPTGVAVAGLSLNNGLRALWGTQNNNIKTPDFNVDKIFFVASYQDPFSPDITYDVLCHSVGGSVTTYYANLNGYPESLPLEHPIGYTSYEGFVSSRNGLYGCSSQTTPSAPSFFLPADNWQQGRNTAPLYIPNLADTRGRIDNVTVFPTLSTPSGVMYDDLSSRAGVTGVVAGFQTFGFIEPGSGLAFARLTGSGAGDTAVTMGGRKFLGNFPGRVNRSRAWMPYSNGIFGMGVVASIAGTSKAGSQTMAWVYDREPNTYPARVVSVSGKYQVKDTEAITPTAHLGARQFDRW